MKASSLCATVPDMWSDMDAELDPEPARGLYADKCEECTTGIRCEDAGRCLFAYFEDGGA